MGGDVSKSDVPAAAVPSPITPVTPPMVGGARMPSFNLEDAQQQQQQQQQRSPLAGGADDDDDDDDEVMGSKMYRAIKVFRQGDTLGEECLLYPGSVATMSLRVREGGCD